MIDVVERIAGLPGKVGVQAQYLDSECHLVGDALASRLHLAPQFEIGQAIVQAVAVFMMHSFVPFKRTAEFVFHHLSLHKLFAPTTQVQSNVAGGVDVSFGVDRSPATTFVAAFFVAKTLLLLVARWATIFRARLAVFGGFTAAFTLERRRWFVTHVAQFSYAGLCVKESF